MQHKSKTLFVLILMTALLVSGCASPSSYGCPAAPAAPRRQPQFQLRHRLPAKLQSPAAHRLRCLLK